MPVTLADAPAADPAPPAAPAAPAAASPAQNCSNAGTLSCKDLNPSKESKMACFIMSVLEEKIASPADLKAKKDQAGIEGGGVLNCVRQTTCTGSGEDYKCDKVEYVAPGKCTPGDKTVYCQSVQVIYGQSGANLLYTYVGLIYRWAAGTAGIVAVLFLVVGGIRISIAQGDPGKTEKAKEQIMNSIAGLVLLFLSALILYTINPNFFVIGPR